MSNISVDKIWIASERHRRSRVLAEACGAKLFELIASDDEIPVRIFRYIYMLIKVISILVKERPKLVFVQNPSVILTLYACVLRKVFRYKLVVDRHSNFKLRHLNSKEFKWRFFHVLSNFTLRNSSLTIVTNDYLADLVREKGGKAFVLPDKLPNLDLAETVNLDGAINGVVVCTFSEDEPIEELFTTAESLPEGWVVYFTGNEKKAISPSRRNALVSKNVRFTGFLNEKDYQSLLFSADVVIVLTTEEYLLTCGAYEGIALGKALVLSNTKTIMGYFRKGAIYSGSSASELTQAIQQANEEKENLMTEVSLFRDELTENWNQSFAMLQKEINDAD